MRGERTLSRFSRLVNLKRFDRQQSMTTDKLVWFIVYHLFDINHYSLHARRKSDCSVWINGCSRQTVWERF
jgi:hypothetical protein